MDGDGLCEEIIAYTAHHAGEGGEVLASVDKGGAREGYRVVSFLLNEHSY